MYCCSAFCISIYLCFKYIYFVFAPTATLSREQVISMQETRCVHAAGRGLLLFEGGGGMGGEQHWKGPMALGSVLEGVESEAGSINMYVGNF